MESVRILGTGSYLPTKVLTNHDLEEDIRADKLRSDLYHRLNEIKIYIEPLRNRPEDIPHLIGYFTKKYRAQIKRPLRTLSKRKVAELIKYPWPGNVRELQNEIKRILVLGETSDRIDKLHTEALAGPPGMSIETLVNRIAIPTEIFCLDHKTPMDQASVPLKEIKKKTRDRIDRELISYVLKKTRWNRGKAAKILDVSYKMLHNKMDELNIKPII